MVSSNPNQISFARKYYKKTQSSFVLSGVSKLGLSLGGLEAAILKAAKNPIDGNDYEMACLVTAQCLREGNCPGELIEFAAEVLEGKVKKPKRYGTRTILRDFNIYRTIEAICEKYQMPAYNNNELSQILTAADILSEASDLPLDVIKNAYKRSKKNKG